MKTLSSFTNAHQNLPIVVCGCGESLNDFHNHERFITIGVNDVGRKFQPDYLVVVNPKTQFKGDRFRFVENSKAGFIFTQLDLKIKNPNVIKFKLGAFGGTDFSNPCVLHYTNNSPYIALNLAILMGAKQIGLIGVDFTDNHFFARTGKHPLAPQFDPINEQYKKLANAAEIKGIEIFNLSRVSRLTAFPKVSIDEFEKFSEAKIESQFETKSLGNADSFDKTKQLKIVSYSTTPVAGVPAILARCIEAKTEHRAHCVWATNDYGNGVKFAGDVEWNTRPQEAENLIAEADLVIVHNGKIAPKHGKILRKKAIITMAHNYIWNVDEQFFKKGFPGAVVGQYQASLPEFKDWKIAPNPIPLWENDYQNREKSERISICYTPFGTHESYPKTHKLYWHSKGFETTLKILEKLEKRFGVKIETTRGGQISHSESLAMKRRSHIVIDECVTGSYHRNSLEGLAAGCAVVNGVGKIPHVEEIFLRCAGGAKDIPFVPSDLNNLEKTLESLISSGVENLKITGEQNRKWMETNWDFSAQWEKFWTPLIESALRKNYNRKTFSIARTNDEASISKNKFKNQRGEIPTMTLALKEDLNLPEFAAFNLNQNYPLMRRWELPFALHKMRLSGFMSVLDATINPLNFKEKIAALYPNVVYRHHQCVSGSKFVLPNGMPDGEFDRAVCINTLEHLFKPQREELLAELTRKLKPGGMLVVTCDQYPESFWEKPELLKMGLVRENREEIFNGFNRVTKKELISTLKKFGLHPLEEKSEIFDEDELHRNSEPYPHTCLGMVFCKSEQPALQKGKKVMLSLLSWNTKEFVLDSLEAYLKEAAMLQRLGCEPFIVVCDNGSTDGTRDALEKLNEKIELPHEFILNETNRGSSVARNQIIDLMLNRGDEYLLMSDGDIEIVQHSSFAMMRYMEEQGRSLGCLGPHSSGFSPERNRTTAFQFDLTKCRKENVNYVAWTQYGMFRRALFEDGIRFDENKPFSGEGWGFEDNDLAFQMIEKNYQIQVFTGMIYLHRDVHSSIRVMKAKGSDPNLNYEHRRNYIINKWNNNAFVPPAVIKSLQISKCPKV